MDKGIELWNKVLTAAMQTPGVKVDRNEFLRKSFKAHYTEEQISQFLEQGTIGTIPINILDELASDCVAYHTRIATVTSFVCGIPGGFAMLGTIPSDLIQYYFHVFVLSQKLAYLYGYPNLCDEAGNFNKNAKDILTVFVGLMGGVTAANVVVHEIAAQVQKSVLRRLPRYALTRTFLYPIVKQVAKWIGINLTKQSFARGLSKVVPLIGGVVSAILTYITFKPQSKRLKNVLRDEMLQAYEVRNEEVEGPSPTWPVGGEKPTLKGSPGPPPPLPKGGEKPPLKGSPQPTPAPPQGRGETTPQVHPKP